MKGSVDLVIAGDAAVGRAAALAALQRGQRVLIVLPPADARAARRLRRSLLKTARGEGGQLRILTGAEVVCADGVDGVEAVVIRHARRGRLSAVNAAAFVSGDGHGARGAGVRPAAIDAVAATRRRWPGPAVADTTHGPRRACVVLSDSRGARLMRTEPVMDWAAERGEKWRRHLGGLEATLAPIDAPLMEALALNAPVRIADVGCGSGATTIEVLRRAPPGSIAHGFDLSPALIELARQRPGADDPSVAFEVADMGTTAPPAPPYDRLMSRLGVMFFADPPAAFANLRRWLVPGGRFAFAVWGPVDDNAWMMATRAAVAEAIDLPPIEPSAPGPFRYGDVRPLVSLLARSGFTDVTVTDWRQALPIGDRLSAPDAAQFALAAFSSFAELLSNAGGDAAAKARRALAARFAPYEQEGVVLMPARLHIVTGQAGNSDVSAS